MHKLRVFKETDAKDIVSYGKQRSFCESACALEDFRFFSLFFFFFPHAPFYVVLMSTFPCLDPEVKSSRIGWEKSVRRGSLAYF